MSDDDLQGTSIRGTLDLSLRQRLARPAAQNKVVSAQNYRLPVSFAEFIDHPRCARARVLSLRRDFQRQFGPKPAIVDVRQLERNEPQTDSALPGLPQHLMQPAIHVGLE